MSSLPPHVPVAWAWIIYVSVIIVITGFQCHVNKLNKLYSGHPYGATISIRSIGRLLTVNLHEESPLALVVSLLISLILNLPPINNDPPSDYIVAPHHILSAFPGVLTVLCIRWAVQPTPTKPPDPRSASQAWRTRKKAEDANVVPTRLLRSPSLVATCSLSNSAGDRVRSPDPAFTKCIPPLTNKQPTFHHLRGQAIFNARPTVSAHFNTAPPPKGQREINFEIAASSSTSTRATRSSLRPMSTREIVIAPQLVFPPSGKNQPCHN